MSAFRAPEKKKVKLKMALIGPSGSGKTFSALRICAGLEGRTAMIDTENGSGELYADRFCYMVAPLEPPYTPQRYMELIRMAQEEGFDNLIIDSLSHAWAGAGGILDIKDKVGKAKHNSFDAWRDVTPQHNALVDAILQTPLHVLVCMRAKTAYELVKDDNGKVKPVKIGLAPVQRDGLEYEFTLVADMSVDEHVAAVTKDRTQLFDGKCLVPTEEMGRQLLGWLNSGADPLPGPLTAVQRRRLLAEVQRAGLEAAEVKAIIQSRFNVASSKELNEAQGAELVAYLETLPHAGDEGAETFDSAGDSTEDQGEREGTYDA
ncbi:MAG: ATP-binding protein [Thermodesulfobacteriota bacterium]